MATVRLIIGDGTTEPVIIDQPIELVPGEATETLFDISADQLGGDSMISIGVWEVDDVERPGDTSVARWPKELDFPLDARDPGPFHVTLVAVKPNSAVGGGLIEFTDELLAEIESDLLAQMPVREVAFRVREPILWDDDLTEYQSWSRLVLELANLRDADGAPDEEMYFGMIPFSPGLALGGLAATLANKPFWRVSIGVRGSRSNVMIHEITHVLGRAHTPCGDPGGPDPYYPYPNAVIGKTGFDYTTGEYVDAMTNYDVMSYCNPVWTSDYTYTAMFQSIRAINEAAGVASRSRRERLHAYVASGDRLRSAGQRSVVIPASARGNLRVDGLERDAGIIRFHDSDDVLVLLTEPLPPGARVSGLGRGELRLAGGVK